MMTRRLRSHTFAVLPNSRLKTPMVPGPHTSWVIRMSALTHTLSPASTRAFPEARARIFSVKVMVGNHYFSQRATATVEIECSLDRRASRTPQSQGIDPGITSVFLQRTHEAPVSKLMLAIVLGSC